MSLDGFKAIFWFEYTHRLLGRMIGLVFAMGIIYRSHNWRRDTPLDQMRSVVDGIAPP